MTRSNLLRAWLLSTAVLLAASPSFAQTLSGNSSAGASSSAPAGTAGTAAPGTGSSEPIFDAVTGKGLLTAGTALPPGANALGTVGVTTLPTLPAGTNGIGTVGVTALPPLSAGTNGIGTVGVTALPALAPGTNNIGIVVTAPAGVTSTPLGGTTSATAGTFTSALAASGTRKGCVLQNNSGAVIYIYPGPTASATIANSLQVGAGTSFGCNPGGLVLQDNLAIASSAASAAYVVVSQ